MVLVIVATILGSLTPAVRRQLTHARVNRAAAVAAADLYLAQALAGRQHTPVRVVFNVTAKTAQIRLTGGSVIHTRDYSTSGDFKLASFTASPESVQVLPNGMINGSLTLTVGDGEYSRQVRMTRAGQIRIVPN